MYCRKCGKEVAETSAFCPNCGERIGKEATAKKKIQISRKTCIVTALLVTMVLVSVVVYLNVIKKGEIHIESYQEYLLDGELRHEYEIDSEEKKIKLDGVEITYCINNNGIEFSGYDEEGKLQKVVYKFKAENKGKTVYLYPDDEEREGYVCKVTVEENVLYYYWRGAYGELQYTYKIEENRIIYTGGESSGVSFDDGSVYYKTEENKLKTYEIAEDGSCSSTPCEIITATDKIEGEKDIIELLQERLIINYFFFLSYMY